MRSASRMGCLFISAACFIVNASYAFSDTIHDNESKNYYQINMRAPDRIRSQQDTRPRWVEPKFGPEFTFSKDGVNGYDKFWADVCPAISGRCRAHLVYGQPEGAKFTTYDGYTFYSPNGWDFTIDFDPGVVEVKMNPLTVKDFRQFQTDMHDAIFASASNVGLFPFLFLGGGHINISWATFANNLLLLRNFIVDFYNHAELSMGILGYDTNNALPLQMLEKEEQEKLRKLIGMIDRGEMRSPEQVRDYLSKITLIRREYFATKWVERGADEPRRKMIAFNFTNLQEGRNESPDIRRFEIRAVRPQSSMDTFVRQISLLRDRIRYLYDLNRPLPMRLEVPLEPIDYEKHILSPPVDPQMALRAFYRFVTESGHRWPDHTDYIWPAWITEGELARFEQSDWFKEAEEKLQPPQKIVAVADCAAALRAPVTDGHLRK